MITYVQLLSLYRYACVKMLKKVYCSFYVKFSYPVFSRWLSEYLSNLWRTHRVRIIDDAAKTPTWLDFIEKHFLMVFFFLNSNIVLDFYWTNESLLRVMSTLLFFFLCLVQFSILRHLIQTVFVLVIEYLRPVSRRAFANPPVWVRSLGSQADNGRECKNTRGLRA